MKTVLLAVLMVALAVSPLTSSEKVSDEEAIIQTALDYIEGWYDGNVERMSRALHPDLAKRAVFPDKETGKSRLDHMGKEKLVGFVEKGYGKQTPKDKQMKEVTILDRYENIACVKVVASDWIDHLQIAKFDGQWVIINVLWELKPKK